MAAAHAVHNGLTAAPGTHAYFHGEKVAFGVLVQLVLEGKPGALFDEVLSFATDVGLRVTLAEIGIEGVPGEMLDQVASRTTAKEETIHNEPLEVTAAMVADAILATDSTGRAWKQTLSRSHPGGTVRGRVVVAAPIPRPAGRSGPQFPGDAGTVDVGFADLVTLDSARLPQSALTRGISPWRRSDGLELEIGITINTPNGLRFRWSLEITISGCSLRISRPTDGERSTRQISPRWVRSGREVAGHSTYLLRPSADVPAKLARSAVSSG